MKSWTSGIRRIVVGILLLCYLYCQKAMAEPLPWPLQAPEANRTYLAILPVMHQGKYSQAEGMWRSAALRFAENPSDQLIFILGLGNQYRLRANFTASFTCYRECQARFKKLISQNPLAKAALLESYADLAFEINEKSTRIQSIEACAMAYAALPDDAPRKSTLARKIGVLCRLVKDLPAAKGWYEIAQKYDQGDPEDRAILQRERAYLAFKENDLQKAHELLDSARIAMEACPNILQEEWISYHFYATELQYAIGSLTSTSVEALENGEKACKAAIEIGQQYPEVVSNLLFVCYGRFAKIRAELGDYAGAIPYAEKSAEGQIARKISPRAISQAYSYLGEFHHFIGSFDQALQYYRQSWLSLKNTTEGAEIYTTRLADYAQELINLQQYEEGEKYMYEAIDSLVAKKTKNHAAIGKSYSNLGIGFLEQQKNDQAIASFENALRSYESATEMHWANHCYDLAYLAIAQNAAGDTESASKNVQRCLVDLQQVPRVNRMDRAKVLEMVTSFYLGKRNFEDALRINNLFMQEMVGEAAMGIEPLACPNLDHSVSPWHTLTAVSQKADILWGLYRETQSLDYLQASLFCSQKALAKLRKLRQAHNNE